MWVAVRNLFRLVDEFSPEWLKADGGLERLDRIMRMRRDESKQMFTAARALRLTNQSRQDPKSAGRPARDRVTGPRPWDG